MRRSRRCGRTRRSINVLDESLYNDIPQDGTLGARNLHAADQPLPPLRTERRRRHRVLRLDLRTGGGGSAQGREDPGAAHRGGDDGRGRRARRHDPASSAPRSGRSRWCAARSTPRRAQAGKPLKITELWVSGARDALNKGDNDTPRPPDRGADRPRPASSTTIVLGMMSMAPAMREDAARARAQDADQRRSRGRAHAQADGRRDDAGAANGTGIARSRRLSSRSPRPPPRRISTRARQISILVAGTAGGGIDIGARILSRHLGKYLPGNPTVVAQLMPGAGGIRMIEHMNTVAPRDGTVIGTRRARADHRAADRQAQDQLPHDRFHRARRHGPRR